MGYFIFCAVLVFLAVFLYLLPANLTNLDAIQRRWAILGALALIVVVSVYKGYTTVPPGNLGVIEVFGRLEPTPLESGLHFVRPWAKVTLQETRLLVYPDSQTRLKYEAISIDQQPVQLEMTVAYQRNDVVATMQNISPRQDVLEMIVVVPATNEVLKDVISRYKISEVLENRDQIKTEVQEKLVQWFERYYLVVKEVSISNVTFSDVYDRAIEEKQKEKVLVDQAEYELQLAQTKAQETKTVATGKANAAIETARGEANAIGLRAMAKAESITLRGQAEVAAAELIGQSYTPLIHMRNVIQKWDGTPPKVQVDPGVTLPLVLPVPIEQLTPQLPPEPQPTTEPRPTK